MGCYLVFGTDYLVAVESEVGPLKGNNTCQRVKLSIIQEA